MQALPMLRREMRPCWDRVSYCNQTGLDTELDPRTRQLLELLLVRYQLWSMFQSDPGPDNNDDKFSYL